MRWLLACLAGIVAPLASLHAQARTTIDTTTSRTREWGSVGIYGGYAYDIIRSAFSVESNGSLSESSDCGRFERGTGGSPLIGITLESPLKDQFRWSILADFHETNGTLRFPCVDPASIRLPDGSVVPALTDHVADISYSQLAAKFLIDVQPSFLPALRFSVGPALTMITSGRYSAREEVVSPANAEFVGGGGQVRQYGADTFTDGTTLSFGIVGGISYRATAGDRFTIAPGISGLMKLTDDLPSVHMRTHTIAATLALIYRIDRDIDTIVPPLIVQHDTIAQPEPLTISFNAKARGKDGKISDTMVFRENKLITTQLRPLLTYLFFDRGDSAIPERYVRRTRAQITSFNENALKNLGTLDIYHNLLDIIGARMRRNPTAAITVTGMQPDASAERGKFSLADARARGVKNYLIDIWKISPDRIAIATRGEPVAVTNPETEEGAAENRRVEISSAVYQITEPVLFADTVNTEELPALTIHPDVVSGGG
ncbi:MAG: OmpA family protein, partial [Candidatus Kapaibacterium sp.]